MDNLETLHNQLKMHQQELRTVGYFYIRQGIYNTALTIFEALVEMGDPHPYDIRTLGAIYLELGDCVKAKSLFDVCLEMEPDHAPTLLNKAKALLLLGYREEGIAICRRLEKDLDSKIANGAGALILAYS